MSNLGIALGAGVDEWHRQQDESRRQEAAARQQEQFGWQRDQYQQQRAEYERRAAQQAQQDALLKAYNDHQEYAAGLDNVPDEKLGDYIQRGIDKYNTDPHFSNNYFAHATVLDGKPVLVHGSLAAKNAEVIPITRDSVRQGLARMDGMLRQKLAATSPEGFAQYYDANVQSALKRDELGVHRMTAEATMRNAATQEQYRKDSVEERRRAREEDVNYMQDGTGRVLGFRQGKLIGTFGAARPVVGGGGADYSLTPQERAQFGDIMARYSAEKDPAKQAAIAREYQLAQSNALLGRGKVPNLPAPMFKGSPLDDWETPVKVKTVGKDGSEAERVVPMRLYDPDGYAKAKRAQAYTPEAIAEAAKKAAADSRPSAASSAANTKGSHPYADTYINGSSAGGGTNFFWGGSHGVCYNFRTT